MRECLECGAARLYMMRPMPRVTPILHTKLSLETAQGTSNIQLTKLPLPLPKRQHFFSLISQYNQYPHDKKPSREAANNKESFDNLKNHTLAYRMRNTNYIHPSIKSTSLASELCPVIHNLLSKNNESGTPHQHTTLKPRSENASMYRLLNFPFSSLSTTHTHRSPHTLFRPSHHHDHKRCLSLPSSVTASSNPPITLHPLLLRTPHPIQTNRMQRRLLTLPHLPQPPPLHGL